jgi:hypothetical protein
MMAYLEPFCAWFQHEEASNRLEMLVTMVQMLSPFEIRFVGACVEELARKDYYYLRGSEESSNKDQTIQQFADLTDAGCRRSLIIALSLLRSGNYSTAAVVYQILQNLNSTFHQLPQTKETFEEITLLLVMAKHHPAFRFEQKQTLAELLERIVDFVAPMQSVSSIFIFKLLLF